MLVPECVLLFWSTWLAKAVQEPMLFFVTETGLIFKLSDFPKAFTTILIKAKSWFNCQVLLYYAENKSHQVLRNIHSRLPTPHLQKKSKYTHAFQQIPSILIIQKCVNTDDYCMYSCVLLFVIRLEKHIEESLLITSYVSQYDIGLQPLIYSRERRKVRPGYFLGQTIACNFVM